MTVVFFHAGSVSVVDTTTFGMLFIRLPNSPVVSSMAGHAAAKPVRGPLSAARIFDDPVQRDELGDDELSHRDLLFLAVPGR